MRIAAYGFQAAHNTALYITSRSRSNFLAYRSEFLLAAILIPTQGTVCQGNPYSLYKVGVGSKRLVVEVNGIEICFWPRVPAIPKSWSDRSKFHCRLTGV